MRTRSGLLRRAALVLALASGAAFAQETEADR